MAHSYHGTSRGSRKNFPVRLFGASSANQTAMSAPSSTDRLAFGPPLLSRTISTYAQNWPAYKSVQTNERRHFHELLADLCSTRWPSAIRTTPIGRRDV